MSGIKLVYQMPHNIQAQVTKFPTHIMSTKLDGGKTTTGNQLQICMEKKNRERKGKNIE